MQPVTWSRFTRGVYRNRLVKLGSGGGNGQAGFRHTILQASQFQRGLSLDATTTVRNAGQPAVEKFFQLH